MGQVLLFCNSCGVIFKQANVHELHYDETCSFCGAHSKVFWRRKPFTSSRPGKNMIISELQRFIIATPVNSRLGVLLQLRFGKDLKVVA